MAFQNREDELTGAGIPYPLAQYIKNALLNSVSTDAVTLSAFGVSGPAAIELSRELNAKTISIDVLLQLGFPAQAAMAIMGLTSGGGGSTPNLTFTRNGTAFQTVSAQGTILGTIGGVPTGVTPTVTPNDGSLAIGGSAGSWTLRVGASASSAGTLNGSINAAGANSVAFSLTVDAASTSFTDDNAYAYAVGDTGQAGSIHEGYTLAWAEEFTDTYENLFDAPHKSPSSAASLTKNKLLSYQTYRTGTDQPGGQLTQSTDTNPFSTGTNDSNRGVPVGSANNFISGGTLTLGCRIATAPEQTAYGAGRKLLSGVVMTDQAIVMNPDAAGTGDVIFESRYRNIVTGAAPGAHPDFWTRVDYDFNGSTTFDVNHENFSLNYLPSSLDPSATGGVIDGDSSAPLKATYNIGLPTAAHDDGVLHAYSFKLNTDHDKGITLFRDNLIEAIGRTSANAAVHNSRGLLTAHVVNDQSGDLADPANGWVVGGVYKLECDRLRVWNRTAAKRYKPLVTVADVNIAAGGSTVITIPAAATLWGEVPTVEEVFQIQGRRNSPGGDDNTQFTNANPFGPGVSYNSGTRQLTVAPSDNKSGRMVFKVSARSPGSTCQPLIVVVNVGPRINFSTVSYTSGVAGTLDVYALVDCGELTTNGTAKAKTLAFTGLPTGWSYSDATGILTWTTAAINGTPTLIATNSVGQATGATTITLAAASVPVSGENAVTTAYVNKMSVSPSQPRRVLINDLIAGLATDGVLTKLKRLSLLAAHDSQAGYLDAIVPATKSLLPVSGGTYTVDRGFAGDGTAAYLRMQETVYAAGASQDSVAVGVWCNQQNGSTTILPHFAEANASSYHAIRPRASAGNETFACSDAAVDVLQATTGSRVGHRTISRTGAAIKRGFYNGTRVADLTTASVATVFEGHILKSSTTYCADRIAAFYVATGLSDAEVTAVHGRLNTYLTAIGAQ